MLTFIFRDFSCCIFIEIQACENERISGCLKILNTRREKSQKTELYFLPEDTKKRVSKKSIFVM